MAQMSIWEGGKEKKIRDGNKPEETLKGRDKLGFDGGRWMGVRLHG